MRLPGLIAATILWQSTTVLNIGTVAAPEHLRYQRAVILPAGVTGLACATLDAELLAHTASPAHDDLRLYRGYRGQFTQAETPFLFTESGPEPVDPADAAVEHLVGARDQIDFDLRMPPRSYSEVQLRLGIHDFVGTATVNAVDEHGHRRDVGTFAIFDLTERHLGSWTALPMAELSDPLLHVSLRLRTPGGGAVAADPAAIVSGAVVPPSRLRQTLYTPIAITGKLLQTGFSTVAVLQVPAHVPVERISFSLSSESAGNYDRQVLVRARPADNANGPTEVIDAGAIQHVSLAAVDARSIPVNITQDHLDATLGATLASSALVRVVVQNRGLPPLPIRSVTLEMRERKVCFLATPDAEYTLRYGDAALAAPVYDATPLLAAKEPPAVAQLGPERRNPGWRRRQDTRPFFDRHPELFWVLVLLCAGMMGASALQYVQHREGGLHR